MSHYVQTMSWDSEFFGRPIGRILCSQLNKTTVRATLEEAQSYGLQCLYFEADPNDWTTTTTAQEHGFQLVDVRVTLEHPFRNRPAPALRYPIPVNLVIDTPCDGEIERLQDIGAQIGFTSRFAFDQNFGRDDCERLYRLWIKNSCNGFADIVLVARWSQHGEAVGLITCLTRDGIADIQLAGIHVDHRQRGVGTGLVQAALDWAKKQKVEQMLVVTQARNVPAQRLYQQMGFFTKSMTLYYHKWL